MGAESESPSSGHSKRVGFAGSSTTGLGLLKDKIISRSGLYYLLHVISNLIRQNIGQNLHVDRKAG